MRKVNLFLVFVPLKKWKIYHPCPGNNIRISEFHLFTEMTTKYPKRLARHFVFVSGKKYNTIFFQIQSRNKCCQLCFIKKFSNRSIEFSLNKFQTCESFCLRTLYDVGQFSINLTT